MVTKIELPETIKKTELFQGDVEEFVKMICKFLSSDMVINHARVNGKTFGYFVTMKHIKLCNFEQTFRGAKLAELFNVHLFLDNKVPNDSIEFSLNKIITQTDLEKQHVARIQRMDACLEKEAPMIDNVDGFFKKQGRSLDEILAESDAYMKQQREDRENELKMARDAKVTGDRVPLIAR